MMVPVNRLTSATNGPSEGTISTMQCFEVMINGKKACTAGVGNDGVLTAILALVKQQHRSSDESRERGGSKSESLDIRVGGLANIEPGTSEHLEWLHQDLSVGD